MNIDGSVFRQSLDRLLLLPFLSLSGLFGPFHLLMIIELTIKTHTLVGEFAGKLVSVASRGGICVYEVKEVNHVNVSVEVLERFILARAETLIVEDAAGVAVYLAAKHLPRDLLVLRVACHVSERSEERRVGKEC